MNIVYCILSVGFSIQTVSEKNWTMGFSSPGQVCVHFKGNYICYKVKFVPFNFIDEKPRYNHLTEEVNKSR